jgi:membrane associated rhomboid family serine protease
MTERLRALVFFIGPMWLIHAIRFVLGPSLLPLPGIVPRTMAGLPGIITAPFLHASWQHLIGNTSALVVLSALVLLRGVRQFVLVLQICILTAGFGTWLFGAPNTMHIGASGVVFGFFAFLVARSWYERTVVSALVALAVVAIYGLSMGVALIPQTDISWTGHAFGAAGGVLAAKWLTPRRRRTFSVIPGGR